MAVTGINIIKSWFVTRAKPLQSQFWAWMDSFWHKDEMIPIDKIEGLINILNALKYNFPFEESSDMYIDVVQNRIIDSIWVQPNGFIGLAAFKVGTTPGGEDIVPAMEIPADDAQPIVISRGFTVATRIYLYGLTTSCNITIIYKI